MNCNKPSRGHLSLNGSWGRKRVWEKTLVSSSVPFSGKAILQTDLVRELVPIWQMWKLPDSFSVEWYWYRLSQDRKSIAIYKKIVFLFSLFSPQLSLIYLTCSLKYAILNYFVFTIRSSWHHGWLWGVWQITASRLQENGWLSYWCPKPQFKTGANAQRNTELRQPEAFMGSPPAFLLSYLQILMMWLTAWMVITKSPHLPHFVSPLSCLKSSLQLSYPVMVRRDELVTSTEVEIWLGSPAWMRPVSEPWVSFKLSHQLWKSNCVIV